MVRDLCARERSAQVLSTLLLVIGTSPLLGPLLGGPLLGGWSGTPRTMYWIVGLGRKDSFLAVWPPYCWCDGSDAENRLTYPKPWRGRSAPGPDLHP